ncbi:heavy metal translocating P-type ATPase metal-binding domain-containing protein [Daejeonella sp.]|uniref:heavy metal translocating P-type ATPase n=1 Tax=Daejeonella sp. TaxID=2805397 RepID=UPI0030C57640
MENQTLTADKCYHCGTDTPGGAYTIEDKKFCCIGCQSVYKILSSTDMCSYYIYNDMPGQKQVLLHKHLEYLQEPTIVSKLVDYTDEKVSTITFYIPAIHCSSCIWLLEHLHKLNPGVIYCRIDFLKKQASISFLHQDISLRGLVELMTSVGYEPLISLQDVVKEKQHSVNHTLIKKIAVAGFCMGNVMLLSFPEYLGLASFEQQFRSLFGWLNLAFSIPVTFYCGREFFVSAWAGLRHKMVNLDAPLALIIAVLFLRSAFEIISATGPGFTDTLTGLVFLLLCGRWIKQRTYYHLSFTRDYRSYFPVAVTLIRKGFEKPIAIEELTIGDRILIRNNEIIPADAILMKGNALTDFSFVTGETAPVKKVLGEIVYAGGRQVGEAIELEVIKPVSQSYLTSLWNNDTFSAKEDTKNNFNDSIAKYFSMVTFIIATAAAAYWLISADTDKAWSAFTAVLIVACPCVLALSTPFTLSAVLAIFDKHLFYLKSTNTVEQLAKVDTIVFDKTGTITSPEAPEFSFCGAINEEDKMLAASLARNSMHPLSREIIRWTKNSSYYPVSDFVEIPGKGLSGIANEQLVKIGNAARHTETKSSAPESTLVHLEIDNEYKGYFNVKQGRRPGLKTLLHELAPDYDMHLLSGDNDGEKENLTAVFPYPDQMKFRQSPHEKMLYIEALQSGDRNVMMLGDGLNDAGALKQSNLGVAVTDNTNNFSPACDAILSGNSFRSLPAFIKQAKDGVKTIRMSFMIASSYNLVGVYFAVQGQLSPLTAAVLMPLSTITILTFTSIVTRYYAMKNKLL